MPIEETRFETSSNWSGAYITANRDRHFMQVWGVWNVPEHWTCRPATTRGRRISPMSARTGSVWTDSGSILTRRCRRSVPRRTLVRSAVRRSLQAWIQWWARGNPITVPMPIGLTVNPGDEVLAILTARNPQTVDFVMANLTTGDVMPANGDGAARHAARRQHDLPQHCRRHRGMDRRAPARWCTRTTRCNFPNYHASDFSYCFAIETETVNILALLGGIEQELRGERLIRMFDVLSDPQRTAFISMPSKTSDTSIHVRVGRLLIQVSRAHRIVGALA